jgi:hypothetical protein
MTMLLGDLIGRLDNEHFAEEVLIGLEDLALMRRANDAARENALDLGSFVSTSVRRYLNQAPPDEWTSLMSAMERSDNPASALLKRALASALDHERHDNNGRRLPEADPVRESRPSASHLTIDEAFHGEGQRTSRGSGETGDIAS